MEDRHWFVLYVLVCLEVGIFLTLVPWTNIWERNYFLQSYPQLRALLLQPTVRGAVAGLGLANIFLGLNAVLTRRVVPNSASHSVHSVDSFRLSDDTPASVDGIDSSPSTESSRPGLH